MVGFASSFDLVARTNAGRRADVLYSCYSLVRRTVPSLQPGVDARIKECLPR